MNIKNQKRSDDKSNLITIIFIIGYLLIDFLPSFKTIERVSPQYLYLAVLNIIVTVYCYYKPVMLSQGLVVLFKKSYSFKIYLAFLILCVGSIFSAGNISVALVSLTQLLIVFGMVINITILLYNKWNLLATLFLIFGISVLIQSVFILYDFSTTLDLNKIKGNSGNINILAASLNIKIPFLILGILHFTNWKRILLVFAFLFSSAIILLTSSRATFLGLVVELIIILVGYKSIFSTQKKDYLKLLYVAIPLFISFVFVNIVFSKIGDSDRYKSIGSRVSQIELSQNSTDNSAKLRLEFWNNALQIIEKKPLLGVGIGNWKLESLPYEKTIINDSDISSNAHNDFLEIMAETGILNGLLYFSLFVGVFVINIKRIIYSDKKQVKIVATLCLMLLFSYGIDAFFNFPMHIPAMQLGFCFLLALTILNAETKDEIEVAFWNSKITICILGIALFCFYFAFAQFKASQLEYKFKIYQVLYRQTNTLPTNQYQLSSEEIIANLPDFPAVSYYSEPFVEYAGVALYYEEKNQEALEYFKKANKINPYLGNSDWYIHRIEFKKGNIEDAYKYAKSAFYKRPRNSDFYLSALAMANEKKDTIEMLRIHNLFTKYRTMPGNWINTSNALQLSNYNNKSLISFIDEGLRIFPKDSLLLAKKSSYIHQARDRYTRQAQLLGKEQKFDKAIEYFKMALREDPQNSALIQNIGICYFRIHQFDIAKSYLLKISESSAFTDGKTEYVLAVCYINLKEAEKGCFYLNLAKNKNFPGAAQLMEQYCK